VVSENERDYLRENNVIYYFEMKSHLGSEDMVYYWDNMEAFHLT